MGRIGILEGLKGADAILDFCQRYNVPVSRFTALRRVGNREGYLRLIAGDWPTPSGEAPTLPNGQVGDTVDQAIARQKRRIAQIGAPVRAGLRIRNVKGQATTKEEYLLAIKGGDDDDAA
jgi:hypothetical protein